MQNSLTDTDILAFCLGGCNAEEVAAYGGFSVAMAEAWMARVINSFGGRYAQDGTDANP